ncbi:hypothetical protein BofuT4_uP059450.1 [Botrytis cinerea T4]|uniref:Uncharacterized protein n=1 Tax=Botryotinia fuckeliana (strain T4) TaxID=999810 RepID=G2XV45_BOTF4|nr:hypothetical protein BofuT4_uP059450.1 [Botrytis cinerea T4]
MVSLLSPLPFLFQKLILVKSSFQTFSSNIKEPQTISYDHTWTLTKHMRLALYTKQRLSNVAEMAREIPLWAIVLVE